ncbi:hypothetical protein [Hoeflea ulvae]|uniref:Uncharacterized protein n=1 Tax=Hoeflea ulvae TaxID=2983764 RepID=A0ABT3YJ31_9HYPH|nr:hypothetical protein [Hoeflea ulvae]MCY0095915.1 hypothetical protein [Hoeflea ulvae]
MSHQEPAVSGVTHHRAHASMLTKTGARTFLLAPSLGAKRNVVEMTPRRIFRRERRFQGTFANDRLYRYAGWISCADPWTGAIKGETDV